MRRPGKCCTPRTEGDNSRHTAQPEGSRGVEHTQIVRRAEPGHPRRRVRCRPPPESRRCSSTVAAWGFGSEARSCWRCWRGARGRRDRGPRDYGGPFGLRKPAAAPPPRVYRHVIWIFMENKSADAVVGSLAGRTPTPSLSTGCGLATNYHSITHPSLPNYLAATSGNTHGIASDCQPSRCSQPGPSLFGQLDSAHKSWRSYVESMPEACSTQNASPYAAKHNPAVYYTRLGASCRRIRSTARGKSHARPDERPAACVRADSPEQLRRHALVPHRGRRYVAENVGIADRCDARLPSRSGRRLRYVGRRRRALPLKGEDCPQNSTDPGCHVATLVLSANTPPGTAASAPSPTTRC